MKRIMTLFVLLLLFLHTGVVLADDMRIVEQEARHAREALAEQAREELATAQEEAALSRARILSDRTALEQAIAELEADRDRLSGEVNLLQEHLDQLIEEEQEVTAQLEETDSMVRELVGMIRVNARDIDTLISQNPQSRPLGYSASLLSAVADNNRFPGMDDVRAMTDALLAQIRRTGEVTLLQSRMIDRAGREAEADILFIGPFTAVYRLEGESGFLNHAQASGTLYALSRPPGARMQKQLHRYMEGESEAVPMDISRGAALRLLIHQVSFLEQIGRGGPIVWPILAILVFGLLIVIERTVFLVRSHHRGPGPMATLRTRSAAGDWPGCIQACQAENKPVARVLAAGLAARNLSREDMENVLQEALLKEIPRLERFLSTLGMLAAIAPLLGLLGTVTGMINVFHVITLQGTSDPRLMSGGISEALVTTMLGLSVAIPLMLLHNILNRSVDRLVGDMEEQSVSLVNMIHKQRETTC
ncbi:MotA/TolQ/ExbB proton channel family protein [Desulfobulbus alkaliphilus]|uniref:MotA/TolQ/ExbB proton channel family protein n=1 Tax=Desulfobulbus alkaliphilus TaxID=869814 RepID=UPI0019625004|nr:MotA/TolQ/ExbB proton channel family protein [Desulfobulbus alkaliphilus]MBM9538668.1 MotA/TolQ/ExbB proton channel family protein [Desulfobulbus alkaliphilus]